MAVIDPDDSARDIAEFAGIRFEKVALRFDEPFWRAAGFGHLMVFPRDPGEWMVWVLGLDAWGAGPALVFRFDAARWTVADRVAGGATIMLLVSLFLPWFPVSADSATSLSARRRTR